MPRMRRRRMNRDYTPGPDYQIPNPPGWGLVRHILSLNPQGTALQFGVGEGLSAKIIAEHMPLIGFDSFEQGGLPEEWREGYPAGSLAFPKPAIPNALFAEGWFADTLPTFDWNNIGPVGFIHFDADLYSSTKTALNHMGHLLTPGVYIIFDEYLAPYCVDHEQRAWQEFVTDHPHIDWEVIGHDNEAWGIRIV
ncbi:methyltransferase [Mycobacterium phage Cornie]|uniref:O-methyltransferase n=1 Tax=Mycobacterium phage Cornie TaxID=2704043 RepID=A0A6G6XL26_9CAUD|nr:methyltransferase [Mycobacterium phage Cornie]QIG58473.1 O-methyltransferase [Mycobacterium phage Cornie]